MGLLSSDLKDQSKILVIDDEKLILLTMSAKLRGGGYQPVVFSDMRAAIEEFKKRPHSFSAIITDIMMGEMDGFMFRDVIRGLDLTMPIFFLTALDPEEGSGFLKRILEDPLSYYLPKSVKSEVLLKRIQQIVASQRIKRFIENKVEEDRKNLLLAEGIQKSMLPTERAMTQYAFNTSWWKPMDIVSGDLYEIKPIGEAACLYVLGDIQGHGTSAALAMTAVQSFIKQMTHSADISYKAPYEIANELQVFFRKNLKDVSYMTALICVHRPKKGEVRWISCGAPDLVVIDGGKCKALNPESRGGVPIGLIDGTKYSAQDEVCSSLTTSALCVAYTDGVMDISKGGKELEKMPPEVFAKIWAELEPSAREDGSVMALPSKFFPACQALGYRIQQDDMTILLFGAHMSLPGIYEATTPLTPRQIDRSSQAMGWWCEAEGWDADITGRVQVVLEEKLMNIHDHGYTGRDLVRARVSFRLRRIADTAELTVWDGGTPEPSIQVAAGDSAAQLEKANREMSNHGRGRLMVRALCCGIMRNSFGALNETTYRIPFVRADEREGRQGG